MKQAALPKTNWRERARLFFESQRNVETEEPLPFHVVRYEPREKYTIKYPCPHCIGGRAFLERELQTWRLKMKCVACSREWPLLDYQKLTGRKVDITKY